MRHSLKTGFSFGLTSGVLTTLGLMIGLYYSTHSKITIIGGIITIAIADALSDSLGIHIAEEAENIHTTTEIWEATIATFLAKFIFASTFIIPIILFPFPASIVINIVYGAALLGAFSFYIGKKQNLGPWKTVMEHFIVAAIIIVTAQLVGNFIAANF